MVDGSSLPLRHGATKSSSEKSLLLRLKNIFRLRFFDLVDFSAFLQSGAFLALTYFCGQIRFILLEVPFFRLFPKIGFWTPTPILVQNVYLRENGSFGRKNYFTLFGVILVSFGPKFQGGGRGGLFPNIGFWNPPPHPHFWCKMCTCGKMLQNFLKQFPDEFGTHKGYSPK